MNRGIPSTGGEIRLGSAPAGLPAPADFVLVQAPTPRAGDGEVLVRNRWFLVFPGLRTLIGGDTRDVPLPPLRPGQTVFGPAIGEVLEAPAGSGLRRGDLVQHLLGWREYAAVPAEQCVRLGDVLPDPMAHLAQGSAPYGALTRLAEVRAGDVVLVTGAAGAVGTMAGQIARLLGAARVIGTTRSAWKAQRLTAELGFDEVIVCDEGSFAERLEVSAPDGIDVLVDTVGGEQLAASIRSARRGARFALVGALSGQLDARGSGGRATAEIDSFRVVNLGISIRGYSGLDHPEMEAEWLERFGPWLREDRIRFPHQRIRGIDQAARALPDLISGRYLGAAIVEV
jgi:NADPH-dependent curcumin reductase CurA